MAAAIEALNTLFGRGDDDYPGWLLVVRINILLLLGLTVVSLAWRVSRVRWRSTYDARWELAAVAGLATIGGLFRFLFAAGNLFDTGGIPYSRLLLGYKGHFATAQVYSLIYQWTARDIEHAIAINRWLGALTVPAVFLLCRAFAPRSRAFPTIAAGILALYPLHILFSASDVLAIFSLFLCTVSYLFIATAVDGKAYLPTAIGFLAGTLGLTLLTQARYENVLFLLPPAVFLFDRRRTLRLASLAPAGTALLVFGGIYLYCAVNEGSSYQNPIKLADGVRVAVTHLAGNPFLAIPLLLVGTVSAIVFGNTRLRAAALLPWLAALCLVITTTDWGHHGARVFTNWLLFLLLPSGYGFSLLIERRRWRLLAGVSLVLLGAYPLLVRGRLGAQYLEMIENDQFRSMLAALPAEVDRLIVPDDVLMKRRYRSTVETERKYEMIRAAVGARVHLVGLTEFLERPGQLDCGKRNCRFFYGLPCMDAEGYPFATGQCEEALAHHKMRLVEAKEVVAAPFLNCSIYVGDLERAICEPTKRRSRFALYQIDE